MNPTANTFLLWLAVVALGLFGILLIIALVGLIIVAVIAFASAICKELRGSHE